MPNAHFSFSYFPSLHSSLSIKPHSTSLHCPIHALHLASHEPLSIETAPQIPSLLYFPSIGKWRISLQHFPLASLCLYYHCCSSFCPSHCVLEEMSLMILALSSSMASESFSSLLPFIILVASLGLVPFLYYLCELFSLYWLLWNRGKVEKLRYWHFVFFFFSPFRSLLYDDHKNWKSQLSSMFWINHWHLFLLHLGLSLVWMLCGTW